MARQTVESVLLSGNPQAVAASQTTQAVSKIFPPSAAGSERFRVDTYVGKVVAATGVTCGLLHSSGHNIWSATKTTSVTASTQTTFNGVLEEVSTATFPTYAGTTQADYLHLTAQDGGTAALWLNKQIQEVQTLTYTTVAGTTDGDFVIVEDAAGVKYALGADTTGAAAVTPAGALWTAADHKALVDISGAADAAAVAALMETGWNLLTGFTAAITTNDTAADGTMTLTGVASGPVTDPVPKNFDESGAGSILGVETTAGVLVGAAPTGALYVAATTKVRVDLSPGGSAADSGLAAYTAIAASLSADFTAVDGEDGTVEITQVTGGAVDDPAPKNADDSGAGSISVVVDTAGDDGDLTLSTDLITSTAHGYTDDQAICFSTTGTLPDNLVAGSIYYVQRVDANSYKVRTRRTDASTVVDLLSQGTGVHSATLVRCFSITYNPEVAGDQSYLPLRSSLRSVITTGSGDSCVVADVRVCQAD